MLPDDLRLTRYFRRRLRTALMLKDWSLRNALHRHERRYARADWATEDRQWHNKRFRIKIGIEEMKSEGMWLTEELVRINQRG